MPTTTIVIPCYNEEERLIPEAFVQFVEQQADINFLFVDDGSSDATPEILETLRIGKPRRFDLLRLKENSGKGEAVRLGFLKALEKPPAYLGFWDADLATPLDAIPEFIGVLNSKIGIDVVTGARVKLLGRKILRSAWRHYLGRIFATVVSLMLKMPYYDTQCGAKIFRVNNALEAVYEKRFISRWIFDIEILFRLKNLNQLENKTPLQDKIYEFPLTQRIDAPQSKTRVNAYIKAPLELLRIYFHYKKTDAE